MVHPVLRVYDRFIQEGDVGLIHRSRGRLSNRAKGIRVEVMGLYREKYMGFGPTLASEKFVEAGYMVDHETARRWLIKEGLWERQKKRGPHRKWRERKKQSVGSGSPCW